MYVNVKSTKRRTCYAKPPAERRRPSDARAYIRPLGKAPSAAPATQKPPAERRRPRDASAYIRPLAEHQAPHLPRKSDRHSGGDQGTPGRTSDPLAEHQVPHLPRKSHRQSGGDQGTPGRTSDPWQSTLSHACHAKDTGRAAKTKGRQGVHPTPCRAPSAAPATQKQPADRRRPRDARAYIRPLAPHLPHKRDRQSGGDQGTPGRTSDPWQCSKCRTCHAKATGTAAETNGRQGVHPTPCAALATQTRPAERRRPRDARAYVRPLAVQQVPHLPRKSHRHSGGDQWTPGRTSDPLRRTCHANATGRAAETKGRQGVRPTPGKAHCPTPRIAAETKGPRGVHRTRSKTTKCRTCHANATRRTAVKGRQGVLPTPGSAHCPAPATQKPSDPLQSTKCRTCHANATGRAAETMWCMCEWSVWVCVCESVCVSDCMCDCVYVFVCVMYVWVMYVWGVCEWVYVCVYVCVMYVWVTYVWGVCEWMYVCVCDVCVSDVCVCECDECEGGQDVSECMCVCVMYAWVMCVCVQAGGREEKERIQH